MVPMIVELATKASGKRPTKVGLIGDNTAATRQLLQTDP